MPTGRTHHPDHSVISRSVARSRRFVGRRAAGIAREHRRGDRAAAWLQPCRPARQPSPRSTRSRPRSTRSTSSSRSPPRPRTTPGSRPTRPGRTSTPCGRTSSVCRTRVRRPPREDAGLFAAAQYRSSGFDPSVQLLLTQAGDDFLSRMSQLDRLADRQAPRRGRTRRRQGRDGAAGARDRARDRPARRARGDHRRGGGCRRRPPGGGQRPARPAHRRGGGPARRAPRPRGRCGGAGHGAGRGRRRHGADGPATAHRTGQRPGQDRGRHRDGADRRPVPLRRGRTGLVRLLRAHDVLVGRRRRLAPALVRRPDGLRHAGLLRPAPARRPRLLLQPGPPRRDVHRQRDDRPCLELQVTPSASPACSRCRTRARSASADRPPPAVVPDRRLRRSIAGSPS